MNTINTLINISISIVAILGAYQIYFFPQRNCYKKSISFNFEIDNHIPFSPRWVWIYSGLYYPAIISLAVIIDSFKLFNFTVFSYLILLFIHTILFLIFPVKTPDTWRDYCTNNNLSMKFLSIVHHYDKSSNCFPSMHVSVATLTALHLFYNLREVDGCLALLIFSFPLLICLSTLYTKQHYFADIPPAIILGYLDYILFEHYYYL